MKYLQDTPFSSGGNSNSYRSNWDKVFKNKFPDEEPMVTPKKESCFVERIQETSKLEKADLSRRLNKLTEEVGELAEAYLVISSNTVHPNKTYNWDDVVEEAIDVCIVALDIAFKAGAENLEEISRLAHKKIDKWEKIIRAKELQSDQR